MTEEPDDVLEIGKNFFGIEKTFDYGNTWMIVEYLWTSKIRKHLCWIEA